MKFYQLEIILEKASNYAGAFSTPDDPLLKEIETFTAANHPQSHMLSGHLQGRLLSLLSCMIQPERILEIGTFVGYSALCLAKGLNPEGVLHTIELREADAQTAQANFDCSPFKEKIFLHIGDALTVMEQLKESWDLVFIDADKINYTRYYEAVFPFVRKGGWIIADNVLFHGEVLQTPIKGKNAKAIDQFNRHILADNRIEHVMLTVRDGLMIIRKK
jgi:predicted O-methyltransferase YrrM